MKISIITPTYNREKDIINCINSVKNQKEKNSLYYEHIIVDDGSIDKTEEVIKRAKDRHIKYIKLKKNRGVNFARNCGVKIAKGDYILLLDSDDRLTNGAFVTIKKTKLDFINFFGTITNNKKKIYYIKKSGKYNYRDWLKKEYMKGEFSPLIRREVFRKYKFYEDKFAFESFFWNRVIKEYGVNIFDIPIRIYKFSEDSLSKKLLYQKNAKKRIRDYESYIKEFKNDYLKYNLKKQLSNTYFKLSFYYFLGKNKKNALKNIKKSLKLKKDLKNIIFSVLIILNLRKLVIEVVKRVY